MRKMKKEEKRVYAKKIKNRIDWFPEERPPTALALDATKKHPRANTNTQSDVRVGDRVLSCNGRPPFVGCIAAVPDGTTVELKLCRTTTHSDSSPPSPKSATCALM